MILSACKLPLLEPRGLISSKYTLIQQKKSIFTPSSLSSSDSFKVQPFPMLKRSQRVPPGGSREGGRKHRKLVKRDDLRLRIPQERQP